MDMDLVQTANSTEVDAMHGASPLPRFMMLFLGLYCLLFTLIDTRCIKRKFIKIFTWFHSRFLFGAQLFMSSVQGTSGPGVCCPGPKQKKYGIWYRVKKKTVPQVMRASMFAAAMKIDERSAVR